MNRRFVQISFLVAGLVGAVLAPTVSTGAQSSGDFKSQPFFAQGPVDDADAPVDPTPVEAQQAFTIKPVEDASESAEAHVDNTTDGDGLKIHVTPATDYKKEVVADSGVYVDSTYEEVVVEGDDVRAQGTRFTNDEGTAHFVAKIVWNPPKQPNSGNTTKPKCFQESGLSNHAFNVAAHIETRGAFYPCTGLGGFPGGFTVGDFIETPAAHIQEAVDDYGGLLQIYTTPTTRFRLNGEQVTYSKMVNELDREVRAIGRYQYANGGWLFVAKLVVSPPGERGSESFSPETNVEGARTAVSANTGTYDGPSKGPNFVSADGFHAELTWNCGLDGDCLVTGTWSVTGKDGGGLSGTANGESSGFDFDLDLEVTDGEGFWDGAMGTGDFVGSIVLPGAGPTDPPLEIEGNMAFEVFRP